jgi:hypothetical protein
MERVVPWSALCAAHRFRNLLSADMPAVLRALAGAENSIEKWWQQLEAARKHPEGHTGVDYRTDESLPFQTAELSC